jgi:hypothetical protein
MNRCVSGRGRLFAFKDASSFTGRIDKITLEVR